MRGLFSSIIRSALLFSMSLIFGCGILIASVSGDTDGDVDYNSPRNIFRFAEHLYEDRDYLRAAGEYQRYLFYSPQDADSTLYRIGLCYRLAGDVERAISSFRSITTEHTESRFRSAASYQIAYSHFLSGQYKSSTQYLDQVLVDTKNPDERGKFQALAAFGYLHQRQWSKAEKVLGSQTFEDENLSYLTSELRASAQEGMSLPRKSSLLAGLFSAIVPGTGKIYCKQYGDGFYSLVIVGVTGLLAWDGFRDNGAKSISGWIFGSMSGIFYTGNVYGSAVAARVYNRQLEINLLRRLPIVPDR